MSNRTFYFYSAGLCSTNDRVAYLLTPVAGQGIFIWGAIARGSGDRSHPVRSGGEAPVGGLGTKTLVTDFDCRNYQNLKISAQFTLWLLTSLFHSGGVGAGLHVVPAYSHPRSMPSAATIWLLPIRRGNHMDILLMTFSHDRRLVCCSRSVIVTTHQCGVVMRSVASVSVCVSLCHVRALTFEGIDLQTSFWYSGAPSECLGKDHVSRSWVSRSRWYERNYHTYAGGLPFLKNNLMTAAEQGTSCC